MYTLKRALYDIYEKRPFKQKAIIAFFENKADNTNDFMEYMTNKNINYFYSHWYILSARRYKQHFMRIVEFLIKEHIKNMAYFDFIKAVQPQMVANSIVNIQPVKANLGKIFSLKPRYVGEHNV